ncbi:MAG TPA: hypothetical protein PLL20_02645 [Phycisphaerae bacterium]|nr:hypothetical protein [Phycisphaerae bacterium]HRR83363.1 hypothetical protein [Phycisphaerae bacterium]
MTPDHEVEHESIFSSQARRFCDARRAARSSLTGALNAAIMRTMM